MVPVHAVPARVGRTWWAVANLQGPDWRLEAGIAGRPHEEVPKHGEFRTNIDFACFSVSSSWGGGRDKACVGLKFLRRLRQDILEVHLAGHLLSLGIVLRQAHTQRPAA